MDAKNIFIVVTILILLYYIVSTFLTSSGLTKLASSGEEIVVNSNKMRGGGSANGSYSLWFYVDDWSHNYGTDKIIFKRADGENKGLTVKLGSHTNDIIVSVTHVSNGVGTDSGDTPGSDLPGADSCATNDGTGVYNHAVERCDDADGNEITYHSDSSHNPEPNGNCNKCSVKPAKCYSNPEIVNDEGVCTPPVAGNESAFTLMGDKNTSDGFNLFNLFRPQAIKEGVVSGSGSTDTHTCTVRNVPIQKWVNIIVSFNNTTLDVYMNGKIVKTCLMSNPAVISSDQPIVITPTGESFSGSTSKFTYMNRAMDPQKAWYIYSDGYTSGLGLANMFDKYKFKFSLLENNVETTSVTI